MMYENINDKAILDFQLFGKTEKEKLEKLLKEIESRLAKGETIPMILFTDAFNDLVGIISDTLTGPDGIGPYEKSVQNLSQDMTKLQTLLEQIKAAQAKGTAVTSAQAKSFATLVHKISTVDLPAVDSHVGSNATRKNTYNSALGTINMILNSTAGKSGPTISSLVNSIISGGSAKTLAADFSSSKTINIDNWMNGVSGGEGLSNQTSDLAQDITTLNNTLNEVAQKVQSFNSIAQSTVKSAQQLGDYWVSQQISK